ncbi:MAG TPA: hypothetical protein VK565_06315, partial [Gemmatimonadaceae bacterium]|nr:hypothetical protein [Gemmatimonadaceae bacterium]
MTRISLWILLLVFAAAGSAAAQEQLMLKDGWMIQSSAKVGTDGAEIASAGYHPTGWYAATVPSTVVGALVENGTYPDPFFGMKLRDLPGTTFKIGANFVHTEMDPQSPYAVPWWYRTTFHIPPTMRGKRITLHFDGINYRANVWLNKRRLADSTAVAGTYRHYELDITDWVQTLRGTIPGGSRRPTVLDTEGAVNVLAVEVFAPTPPDLQTTWVDWNPSPPDKNMG